jgi:hypothetical protein
MALLAVAGSWTAIGFAQGQRGGGPQPPPVRVRIQQAQLKPEMVDTFQDLIKNEVVPALKKAGVPWQWTFTNGIVGQGFTFIVVTPVTSYAQFDQPGPLQQALGPAGAATFGKKLRETVVTTHAYIDTLRQDLSIMSNSGTPPALAVVQVLQIVPGKGNEFTKVMTEEWLPLYKKAGWKDVWFYNRNFGGPPQVSQIRLIAKYADLDAPGVLAGMPPDQIQAMLGRRNAVASLVATEIVRYVPDLSFGMPTMPKSTP